MNDLERYFRHNSGSLIHKWVHYFDIYERHLSRFREREIRVLEIGVFHGGSLQMWKHYFGENAKIYGVDINPDCQQVAEAQIEIFIGDQSDRGFLKSLVDQVGSVDILIDDGGHRMEQQLATFQELFPHIHEQGVYLCEDLHTSYWPQFGGGYRSPDSFIEYTKNLIDLLHAWHFTGPNQPAVSEFTRSVDSLNFYDSVLVIEKKPRHRPYDAMTGQPRVASQPIPRARRLDE